MPAHTENSIVVDAPMDLVWEMTNDVANWPNLFSEYQEAEILERRGDTVKFRLAMHPDENGTVWSWVSERTADPVRRVVDAKRVETGPFEFMHIHWSYVQTDEGVRMVWQQDFEMKPTAPVTTETMAERINTNTKVQQERIRTIIEDAAARTR